MHASKFGLLLLAAVAFATPACFTVDKSDDDDGGESGDDSGGSSGKGGSGSGGSSSGSGGSTSGSGGSSSGSGGSSGGACNLSGYVLPEISCPAGSVTYLDDPTCLAYFSCLVITECGAAGSQCAACITANEDAAAGSLSCTEGTTSGYAAACASVSQDSAADYPDCVIDG